jgi:serine protease Do
MKQHTLHTRALVSLAGAALWAGGLVSTLAPSAVHAQPAGAPLVQGLPDFTALVDLVGPSVVNIRTLSRASENAPGSAGPDEQMLEFFRRFGIPIPPGMTPRGPRQERGPSDEAVPRGVGSGFALSADGYIMTNAHVVEGADELHRDPARQTRVQGPRRGGRQANRCGRGQDRGLGPQSAVKIGDVNRLRVGEWVMAIGSPFGLENSVTAGIVSAKQRDTGDFLPFIQTDVAINPGNSGGPLINMRGEVVGINSQIYSRSGGFQGISFAIPIDEAVRVSEQLRTVGRVTRGRIGVGIDQVSKEVAESIGLGKPAGALVRSSVEPDSPAAKAGVEPGDIILRFDGRRLSGRLTCRAWWATPSRAAAAR